MKARSACTLLPVKNRMSIYRATERVQDILPCEKCWLPLCEVLGDVARDEVIHGSHVGCTFQAGSSEISLAVLVDAPANSKAQRRSTRRYETCSPLVHVVQHVLIGLDDALDSLVQWLELLIGHNSSNLQREAGSASK